VVKLRLLHNEEEASEKRLLRLEQNVFSLTKAGFGNGRDAFQVW